MRTFCGVSCALLLGCGSSTIYLERPPDAAVSDAAGAPGRDAASDDVPTADAPPGCHREALPVARCPAAAVSHANEARPAFRVAQMHVDAPAALASALILNVLNDAIREGGLRWGVSLDLRDRRVRTGAMELLARGSLGLGLIDGRYRFFASGEWAAGEGALTVNGDRVSSALIAGPVRLPVSARDGSVVTTLPLRCLRFVDVSLASGRCLGSPEPLGGAFDECQSRWGAADRVEAVIAVDDARGSPLAGVGTLCDVLAGGDCRAETSTWARPPDATCGDAAGYRFSARLAAISARVE
jgi:hypothetical protein